MVVEGVCLLVVLIGRLGRHGPGVVGMLNEVPAAGGKILQVYNSWFFKK